VKPQRSQVFTCPAVRPGKHLGELGLRRREAEGRPGDVRRVGDPDLRRATRPQRGSAGRGTPSSLHSLSTPRGASCGAMGRVSTPKRDHRLSFSAIAIAVLNAGGNVAGAPFLIQRKGEPHQESPIPAGTPSLSQAPNRVGSLEGRITDCSGG
jgi:hypothetical protein